MSLPELHELADGARFIGSLPRFLRHPISPAEARRTLAQRQRDREANFLATVRRATAHPSSPYRALFAAAVVEVSAVEAMVRTDGVEGALQALYRHGVYLASDELKGRRPAVRGSTTVEVSPALLRGDAPNQHLAIRSSGSSGRPTQFRIDLASERDAAVNLCLSMHGRGVLDCETAHCSVPGGSALAGILRHAVVGAPIRRWFCPVDPGAPGLDPRYLWSARALRLGGQLAGVPMPAPEVVPMEDPTPIARWMHEVLQRGGRPHLRIPASRGVQVCQAALDRGIDIAGAALAVGGEPLTEARQQVIVRAGVDLVTSYTTVETGTIAYGCLAAQHPDEMHVYGHTVALIQPGDRSIDRRLPATALLATSLSPYARLPLINACVGDQAVLFRRPCGCPLEALGWTTHLHEVRSFEKLTSGGMTFLGSDVLAVLEETLPARCGGAPTDYQLLEDEGADGTPRLRLLIHPRLGPLDEEQVRQLFLEAISAGTGVERVMGSVWRDAGFITVERREPEASTFGKIHHFRSATARRNWALAGPGDRAQ